MKRVAIFVLLTLLISCASAVFATPSYNLVTLGFTDSEHTPDDGFRDSYPYDLNEAGQALGYSQRYNGNSGAGRSVWLYDGTTTIDIGLVDAEHTRSNGIKSSTPHQLNEAGQATGYSQRYNGSTNLGQSTWLYDGTTTIDIGLIDAAHTRTDDYKHSEPSQLNEAGQVLGFSKRYNGNSDAGLSVWLYDGTKTMDIGLVGPEYTSSDDTKKSYSYGLNEAGQVAGLSYRYIGSDRAGQSAWLYDGTTTIDIGLIDPEHTNSSNGITYNAPHQLNGAGQVAGYSYRYSGSTPTGTSAWLYDGTTTIDVGLVDTAHTALDDYKHSIPVQLNDAGQVTGISYRYSDGVRTGQSAWLYDGTTTIDIGLVDAAHTRKDEYEYSIPVQLNDAGHVTGISYRYSDGVATGQSAWLFDGTTTKNIGLVDSIHTRGLDDFKYSSSSQLNEAGQATGISKRFSDSRSLGQDAWFYDPVLDQTFPLTLATTSDGHAFSEVKYLGEDGLVIGTYTLYDQLEYIVDDRAFYFTVADGLHDLGSLVKDGLRSYGWQSLAAFAVRANSRSQILGYGRLTYQLDGQVAYLLTPVPEPSTLLLLYLGALGVAALGRRQRSR